MALPLLDAAIENSKEGKDFTYRAGRWDPPPPSNIPHKAEVNRRLERLIPDLGAARRSGPVRWASRYVSQFAALTKETDATTGYIITTRVAPHEGDVCYISVENNYSQRMLMTMRVGMQPVGSDDGDLACRMQLPLEPVAVVDVIAQHHGDVMVRNRRAPKVLQVELTWQFDFDNEELFAVIEGHTTTFKLEKWSPPPPTASGSPGNRMARAPLQELDMQFPSYF